jgi:hypothetical protein
MTYDEASHVTTTGDVWLFRGTSTADKAIRTFTNSPVNHVGMIIALDGLPPLLWHAELGKSIPDVWTGQHTRGAQLHRLDDAVSTWVHTYGQRPWMRQIDIAVSPDAETAAVRTVAEFSGRTFPRTAALAKRWVLGRIRKPVPLTDLYCAEVVAITYERMGLLESRRPANWYDPGSFWSGDELRLEGASLGEEIEIIDVPPRTRA